MAVDREFAYILFMCISFVICSLVLGVLRCLWSSFCSPWSDFGFPFAPLGCRWVPLGHLGLPSGACSDFGSKLNVLFRQYLERLRCLCRKSGLLGFSPGSRYSGADIPQSRQSGARAAAPNPTSLAPGARMT